MQSSKNYINTLHTVYFILLIILVISLSLSVWFIKPEREQVFYIEYLFTDFAVAIIGVFIAFYYPYKLLQKAKIKIGLREKLNQYMKAMFIRWVLIFIVTIYSIVGYIFTHKYIFIFMSLFILIVFILTKTSKKIICEQLELNSKESGVIFNPNAAI